MSTFTVIGVSCSPRSAGNTDILVQHVLATIVENGGSTDFVRIADLSISPCDACWACSATGQCHLDDDMQAVYPKLLNADGVVIGSPVHMGYSVSGHAQVFFDRTFSLWHQKRLKNKVGGCVAVSNRRGGISAIQVIHGLLSAHQMIPAGYATGYGHAPGDVRKDERALKESTALGGRLCDLIRMQKRL